MLSAGVNLIAGRPASLLATRQHALERVGLPRILLFSQAEHRCQSRGGNRQCVAQ